VPLTCYVARTRLALYDQQGTTMVAALLLYDHSSSICSQMARLALVEKQQPFTRREIDIMDTNEQFEPWYVALNPRAVVPTLAIGDEIVTDTIRTVNRVQALPGPNLSGDGTTQLWLRDIMALHYGVLLYQNRLDPDGAAPQIVARGRLLGELSARRPGLRDLIDARLEGNRRLQALLEDRSRIEQHVGAARDLVGRMTETLAAQDYLAGDAYSLADCFATAALARFRIHGFEKWWAGTATGDYYARMKARPGFEEAEVIDTGTERDL
jgi:glutathione S-transferase